VNRTRNVEVAVPLPLDQTLDYQLGEGMSAEPGVRVLVPCAGRRVVGVVVGLRPEGVPPRPGTPRSVIEVLDATPVLPAPLLDVVLRAAHDALCPPGVALAAAIPPGTSPRPERRIRLLEAGRKALERGEARGSLRRVLSSVGRSAPTESQFKRRFAKEAASLDQLERVGWVRRELTTAPARVRARTRRVYRLDPSLDPEDVRQRLSRAKRQLELFEKLLGGPQALPSGAPLRAMRAAGIVTFAEEELTRARVDAPLVEPNTVFELTSAQRVALKEISAAVVEQRSDAFLLYGVTGSGKTEVYLRVAAEVVRHKRGVIVLVPEISLTHQLVDRFRARFGDAVAVLHSGLSAGERFDQWRSIREGSRGIAIGARSAIFAPFEDLGLVVIDEEHDSAYKSEEGFRYHARDVALLRSRASDCPLVLGSATPDVGTSFRCERGEVQRLVLPERVMRRPLPDVEIVDMNAEHARRGHRRLLSGTLRRALAEALAAGNQAILFLNRRGFATRVYCYSCGYAVSCPHCDISLVYHATGVSPRPEEPEQGELRCHYCGHSQEPLLSCPSCGAPEGALLGFGTERLEEDVAAMFGHARVGRLDRDTSSRRGAQRQILAEFHRGEIDVLIGTQMIAKGHDVPGVTLVGVVAADLGLHFPDFRASERTFQLLTQVAGRAGRGDEPGRVVVQTFLPDHYAIALAREHDYPRFLGEELSRRKPHGYPPYRTLLQVGISGKKEVAVEGGAETLAELARAAHATGKPLEVLGPAPAPIRRVRDRFRWQLLLLGDGEDVHRAALELRREARARLSGVDVRLDVGPLQML
jgi:primosomal protein N' (replication factor Y)